MTDQQLMNVAEKLQNFFIKCEDSFNNALDPSSKLTFTQECLFARQQILKNSFSQSVAMNNQLSLKNAILNVAAIGLSLNPASQHAYLVPRDGSIVLDISYRGLVKLATDSGIIKWVRAEPVYANDKFTYHGTAAMPEFTANPFRDRGEQLGVYCVAKSTDGDYFCDTMDMEQINKIMHTSKAYTAVEDPNSKAKTSPWHDFPIEMQKKSLIKRASKLWPQSAGKEILERAVTVLNEHEGLVLDPYTMEDKETFDRFVSSNENADVLEFISFYKGLPNSSQIALMNSFPKGAVSKGKEVVRRLETAGFESLNHYVELLDEDLKTGDEFGAKEKLEELPEHISALILSRCDINVQEWVEGL